MSLSYNSEVSDKTNPIGLDVSNFEALDEVFGRWETGFNFFENWPKIVLEMGDWFFQNGSREHNFLLNEWSKTLMFFINNHFLSSKATQEQGFLSFLWMKTLGAPSEKCGNCEIWWKNVGNWGIQPPPSIEDLQKWTTRN